MDVFDLMEEGLWETKDGRVLSPDEMDEGHRANLLAFLRRNASSYKARYDLEMFLMPMPDPDTMAFDLVMGDFEQVLAQDAMPWIESFPLYQRLAELVEG